jgi:hypothetical protein
MTGWRCAAVRPWAWPQRRAIAAAVGVALVAAPAVWADEPQLAVIQSGRSAGGQDWTQRAGGPKQRLIVELELPTAAHSDGGGGIDVPLPRGRLPLVVGEGVGVGPASEFVVQGIADRSARRILITLADGRAVRAAARVAPVAALALRPQLARARFFVAFLPPSERPTRVTARDGRGHVVGRAPLARP